MDWKSVIGKAAPYLGSALGGPLGSVALSTVADALGLSEKTEGAIKQALSGVTPEQVLAIKNAENAFAFKMREMGFANAKDMESIAVGDRDSARKREMTVLDKTPRNLAYGVSAGFFSILIAMLFFEVPASSRDILNVMLGTLGAGFSGVLGFYFGSSAGSAKKTELLSKAESIVE